MFINSVSGTTFTSTKNAKAIIEELEISSMRERIADIALKRMEMEKYYGNCDIAINKRDSYDNAFLKLDWECDMLLGKIEEIQKNRYDCQLKEAKK